MKRPPLRLPAWWKWAAAAALLVLASLLLRPLMTAAGRGLVREDPRAATEAAVVLQHGIDVYSRMGEAARLYREGWVGVVVINGGRKPPRVKEWERQGLKRDWRWDEEFVPVLVFLGVPREKIVTVTADDAFDTVSEARLVGEALLGTGIRSITVVTSRYHTRRAGAIWERMYRGRLAVSVAGARDDFFSPEGWWREGRQVKVLLSEYGAWLFLFWQGEFGGS